MKKTEPHCCGSALVLQFAPAVQAAEAPWQWLESAPHRAQPIRSELARVHLALVQDGCPFTLIEQGITDIAAAVEVVEEGRTCLPGAGVRMVRSEERRVGKEGRCRR